MTIPKTLSGKSSTQQPGLAASEAAKQNRQRTSSDGTCKSCCRCVVISVVLLLIVACGVAALVYRKYQLDGNNLHTYHDGDQVLVSRSAKDLNSVLCQAYTVTSGSSRASFFLTDGPARISADERQVVVLRNTGLSAEDEFDYRAFYLLPGSEIEVKACMSIFNMQPRIEAEVVFIKGDKHFNRWKGDSSCRHCVEHRVPVPADSLCEAGIDVMARYVIGDAADTYYIVITRQYRADDNVPFTAGVEIMVVRTRYDTSGAKEMCLRTSTCRLNLTYNAHDDVIVQFPSPAVTYAGFVTYFTTECQLRRIFWLSVFVVVPAVLLALLLAVVCARRAAPEADRRRRAEKKEAACRSVITVKDETESP